MWKHGFQPQALTFFQKFCRTQILFCGATDIIVFGLWWYLPWVSKPRWIPPLRAFSPVCNEFLRFTCDACWLYSDQDGNMPFQHTYLQTYYKLHVVPYLKLHVTSYFCPTWRHSCVFFSTGDICFCSNSEQTRLLDQNGQNDTHTAHICTCLYNVKRGKKLTSRGRNKYHQWKFLCVFDVHDNLMSLFPETKSTRTFQENKIFHFICPWHRRSEILFILFSSKYIP